MNTETDPDAFRVDVAEGKYSVLHDGKGKMTALTPEEFRGFLKGNILKYVWREKHKGGDEDLKKAAWYMNRLTSPTASTSPST